MIIQELKDATRLCIECEDGNINVELFILLKDQTIRRANFLQALQPEIVTMFTKVIKDQLLNAEYSVLNGNSAQDG